jgi:SAM-dependent methyltransferase
MQNELGFTPIYIESNLINILREICDFIYISKVDNYCWKYYEKKSQISRSWYGFTFKSFYHLVAAYCIAPPLNIPSTGRILDIGCGIGLLVEQFCRLGYQAVGVDISKAAIELSLCPDKCFLVESSAQLDYPDGYFDLVVSHEVLEHISSTEIDRCISEWQRVSRDAMVHFIAVTDRGPSASRFPTHINIQSDAWWLEKFQSYGYKVVGSRNLGQFRLINLE